MLYLERAGVVIGNLGWIDKGRLWIYDVATKRVRKSETKSDRYVKVRRFGDLIQLNQSHGSTATISLRRIERLDEDVAELNIGTSDAQFAGDSTLWRTVDPTLLVKQPSKSIVIHIDADNLAVRRLDLSWYNGQTYDLGYQGLVDAMTLPDQKHALVSVQRSSKLVLIDIESNKKTGEIELADGHGNPLFKINEGNAIVTVDYDTICRVDLERGVTILRRLLQEGHGNSRQFVGDATGVNSTGVLVPRPFSGDVLVLDRETFEPIRRGVTGQQPLEAVVTPENVVIARDWKTGNVLTAPLKNFSPMETLGTLEGAETTD
ncbi:MAG TPA: hypothetical protein VGK84_10545 [Candidatus Tumulicola sp.]